MEDPMEHGRGPGQWIGYRRRAVTRLLWTWPAPATTLRIPIPSPHGPSSGLLRVDNKPAVDFFASLLDDEKVVLIAHSMGGYTNLELMERFPQKIAVAIFVSASVTPSGVALNDSPLADLMFKDTALGEAAIFTFANGPDKPPTSLLVSDKYVAEVFYTGCSPEDIELAKTLVKWYPMQTLGAPITYTKERHGQVPAVYVKNLRDNTLLLRAQNFVVENYGPFEGVVEVDAGHFSAWSHADEFVKLILLLAEKYDVRPQM